MESSAHIVGDYRIESLLGKSDTSAVYLANRQSSEEMVAIRFFVPEGRLDPSLLRRCERAAENLETIKHPGLVEIRDTGIYRGVPYLVSDYVSAKTLEEKLDKPLPPVQAARLLLPVAKAIVYLHEHHLPHRNVHAGNILAAKGLLLSDCGVQQMEDLVLSKPANPSGWVLQDVRGLGSVYLQMVSGIQVSGEAEWTPEQVNPVLRQISRQPGYSNEVEMLIRSALPGEQVFGDMQAFARALEEVAHGEKSSGPVTAGTPDGRPTSRAAERRSQKSERSGAKRKRMTWLVVPFVLIFLAMLVVGALLLNTLRQPGQQPEVTAISEAPVLQPVEITQPAGEGNLPAAENTTAPAPLPTGTDVPAPLGIGSVQISEQDGMQMVYVPAGEFWMGSDDREEDEKPMHQVYLDAYWIDRTEVSNGQFSRCVEEIACQPPVSMGSSQRPAYHNDPGFADYPVIFVTWGQANEYCRWAGRRLPTEAEWEKAARGPDGYISPWGNNTPSPNQLNYNSEVGDTTQTGSYPAGGSVYGALDMAGNVWEWVSDWYSSGAYSQAIYENPTGPQDGTRKVLRGGSWYYGLNDIRAANRFSASDNTTINDIGFRCVLPAE